LAGAAGLNGMRLRRQVVVALTLVVAVIATASVEFIAARAAESREAAAAAALRAHERSWRVIEALLVAPPGVAAAIDLSAIAAFGAPPLRRVVLASRNGDVATAATPMQSLLAEVAAATGAIPVLTDAEGRVIAFPASATKLARAAERLRGVEPGSAELFVGDRVIVASTVPLRDAAGEVVGGRRWLVDVTERRWAQDRDDLFAAGSVLGIALLLTAALALWLRQAFAPMEQALAAQAALADGDLTVALPLPHHGDEIGTAARALAVFRDCRLRLRRRARTDAWRQQLQLRLLEAECGGLAAVVAEPAGLALQRTLRRLLTTAAADGPRQDDAAGMGALPAALSALAAHLRAQHAELRGLRQAQREAAAGAHRLDVLERQFATLAALPKRIAAPALSAISGVATASECLSAPSFGGDFHDVFWLDGAERRRLAILMASVRGAGVEAALLTVTARALIRAIAAGSASPGACLSQVSDAVLRDNDQRLPLTAWLGFLDLRTRSLMAAGAAAPAPLLLTRPGEAEVLRMEVAPPLGLRPNVMLTDTMFDLPERAALALVSRGVPEALHGAGSLDLNGFAELLARSPALDPEVLLAHAMAAVAATDTARATDASMVVARLSGAVQHAPGRGLDLLSAPEVRTRSP